MSGHPPYPPSDPQQQQPGVGGYGVQQSPYGVAGAPGAGQPVMQQPVIMNPAAAGTSPMQGSDMAGAPPGLGYLAQVNQLIIKQKVEILEAVIGFETQNKYTVFNSMGQQVFKAKEDTNCINRQCCGPARPFDMKLTDNHGNEVIHLDRPLRCSTCCFPCCLQKMEVQSPPGTVIGTLEQDWSILHPKYTIRDERGNPVLKIQGPICTWSCFGSDVEFKVLTPDGEREIGMVTKQWTGVVKEAFTDADNFSLTFPIDLDVKVKATLLGAVFLIDFMFFEKKNNESNDAPGMMG